MMSTWDEGRALIEQDPRFSRVPDERDRMRMFDAYVRDLYNKVKVHRGRWALDSENMYSPPLCSCASHTT